MVQLDTCASQCLFIAGGTTTDEGWTITHAASQTRTTALHTRREGEAPVN